MQFFYVEESSLPAASLTRSGIVRLFDFVPSQSLTEAAIIHVVGYAFHPAVFGSNLAVAQSNYVALSIKLCGPYLP